MSALSYAVVWREGDGPVCAGRLDVAADRPVLVGRAPGRRDERRLVLDAPEAVSIERGSLQVRRRCGRLPVRIGSVEGPGVLREIAELLTTLVV